MTSKIELESKVQKLEQQIESIQNAHNLFLHKISHDIKTPSNYIVNVLHQLLDTESNAHSTALTQSALAHMQQLNRFVDQLVTLDELANNTMTVTRSEFNLEQLLSNAQKYGANLIKELGKQATLNVTLRWIGPPANLEFVTGDQDKIRKIINELLTNSMTHTSHGLIEIQISCLEKSAANVALEISIQDCGSGIDPAHLASIFSPLTQYTDFFQRGADQVGLSLMLCHKLAHLMSGCLKIESMPGKGTRASLRIGLAIRRSSVHSRPQLLKQNNSPYIKTNNKPILVVDDNVTNVEIISAILRRQGFEVRRATNGREAVKQYDTEDLALIFMDCQMPIMNGFEATKIIRSKSNIPIIAVTANTKDGDIKACRAAGMNDVISKPITPYKIGEALSQWLCDSSNTIDQSV